MKINQISPTKLICEDDKFWTSFTQFFVIGSLGAACYTYGVYASSPSFKIGLYALVIGSLVCLFKPQLTTTFDINRKFIQFRRHWFLFQGNYYKQYSIAEIKNIEVYKFRTHYYHPAIRLKNGKVLILTNSPTTESNVMQDISIIQGFLGLGSSYR